jgi:hypothetical protein
LYNPFGIQKIVNKYSKNRGRKRVEIDMEAMKNIPLKQRSTIRELANALGVKKSTKGNRRGKSNDQRASLCRQKQRKKGGSFGHFRGRAPDLYPLEFHFRP